LREAEVGAPSTLNRAFADGLFTNLLNPKVGVFYVSFLPQFVPASADVAVSTFLLVCVHGALSLAWFGILIAAAKSVSRWLRRPAALTTLDRLTGGVFVAFGVKLAASSAV
jgi:threonine/homoserine/homoserine lactone efflux protein